MSQHQISNNSSEDGGFCDENVNDNLNESQHQISDNSSEDGGFYDENVNDNLNESVEMMEQPQGVDSDQSQEADQSKLNDNLQDMDTEEKPQLDKQMNSDEVDLYEEIVISDESEGERPQAEDFNDTDEDENPGSPTCLNPLPGCRSYASKINYIRHLNSLNTHYAALIQKNLEFIRNMLM